MFAGDEEVDGEHHEDRRDPDPAERCRARPCPEVQVHPVPARPGIGQLPKSGVSRELQVEQERGERSPPESEQSSCKWVNHVYFYFKNLQNHSEFSSL